MSESFVKNFNNFNLRKSSEEVVFRSSERVGELKQKKPYAIHRHISKFLYEGRRPERSDCEAHHFRLHG
jgi:hypothetical protein